MTIYPAPPGETLSNLYEVSVNGQAVPVYQTRVAPRDDQRRWRAMDDKKNSAEFFDMAAFAYFDMAGPVTVTVSSPGVVQTAKVLPSSFGITPRIEDNRVMFELDRPRHLTVEVNGEWISSLHLFANPPETDVPDPDDPSLIYFGPGIHEITRLVVGDGKTVYVAGGAIVRMTIGPDEPFSVSDGSGLRHYAAAIEFQGKNITLRGRGIIDGSACPTHSRNPVLVMGSDITLEGVILRDSPSWTVPIRRSDRVLVRNLKLLGYRANSDGIDICNSRDVTVEDCFLRTLDDLIVIKSDRGQGKVARIKARRCVLWNQVAHALSVGAELREDVDDVLFTDCDVIHDQGREWSLRVFHSDSALVTNIRFENIRIEESRKLVSLWIGKGMWSRDEERGHIQGVVFKDIEASGDPLAVQLLGFDAGHVIQDVAFENVRGNDQPLTREMIHVNEFVKGVSVRP